MNALIRWIDDRTGLVSGIAACREAPVVGGAGWMKVWPCTIMFSFVVQAISGFFLWMLYSPGAQTAWESVYYLQYEIQGGWFLRAVHHYSAQVLLVLVAIYLIQMIVTGAYRAPREFKFWVMVFVGLVVLGLMLTGDLLAWDQNSFWATQVRTKFLALLPAVGGDLYKLAIGGPAFGHLTLTRFVALHVGLFTASLGGLLVFYVWAARKATASELNKDRDTAASVESTYWPNQALRSGVACLIVMGVVVYFALSHGTSGGAAGVELGAPADPADAYAAARPEWAFLGLYEFSNKFPGELKLLPIFVFPTILLAVVLLMPIVGRFLIGHVFNILFTVVILGALAVLSFQALEHDRLSENHQQALADGQQQAERVKLLAQSPQGIPVGGALTLLRNDAKTQGPKLFEQHCASCHGHFSVDKDGEKQGIVPEKVSAPNLAEFATRGWLLGMLDPKKIVGPDYFGETKFKRGDMAGFVKETFEDLEDGDIEDRETLLMALSAEAALRSQKAIDARDKERIAEGKDLIADDFGCTDCHKFHDEGQLGDGPELTGYGSRQWILGIIANPAHKRFYGDGNDRMPAYAETPQEPAKNILTDTQIGMLADWLRGEWYEPPQELAK